MRLMSTGAERLRDSLPHTEVLQCLAVLDSFHRVLLSHRDLEQHDRVLVSRNPDKPVDGLLRLRDSHPLAPEQLLWKSQVFSITNRYSAF
jgi:hypothetical protein